VITYLYKINSFEAFMEIDVTDVTFESEVLEKSKDMPVLVDFWASWCGPCQMLGPTLSKIADAYDGKVVVAKMSVEERRTITALE